MRLTLDLYAHLTLVPLAPKIVHHTPAATLLTLFLGLLCGNQYLTARTNNPAPL